MSLAPTDRSSWAPAKVSGGFDVSRPIPVSPESVSMFLSVLRSMSRPPLTAVELARQFGPDGEVARELVSVLPTEP